MNFRKGFTLIELLVVISIIVLLGSIILIGVMARVRDAKDERIIADMGQIRIEAGIVMATYNSYIPLDCNYGLPDNKEMQMLCNDIDSQDGKTPNTGDVPYPTFYTSDTEYCVTSELLVDYHGSEDRFCIDSHGNAGRTTTGCSGFTCVNLR